MSRAMASGRIGDLGITKALHLYGVTNSAVDFGIHNFLDGTPFCFGARIWPTSPLMTDDGVIWSMGFSSADNNGYAFRPDATTRKLQFFYGANSVTCTNYVPIGKHYMFAEFDGTSTLRIYRNTTLMDTLTITGRTAKAGVHTFYGQRDGSGRFFRGVLGDGCIYSRVLTANEKAQIVAFAKYPSGSQLQPRCDENTGTAITDYSGNARTGTLLAGGGLWRNSPFNA